MAEITYREAIRRGLQEALDNEPNALLMGEDIGAYGGAYAVTKGFLEKYGEKRVRDMPIAEAVIVGTGIGAAVGGLKPVVEIMTINFSLIAFDQIVNMAAKFRYMTGGQVTVPMIIRTVSGGGNMLGATHSQNFEHWLAGVPGLKVVVPASPADALGLFRTAFADKNPVMFIEHSLLYGMKGEVPDDYYEVPFGLADVKREGTDVTIVSYLRMTQVALKAAERLAQEGISAEVVDLRTLRPLDIDTVVESVKKTNRAVVVEEAVEFGGFGGEVVAQINDRAFDYLDGPVLRVGGIDAPLPYSRPLEQLAIPNEDRVIEKVRRLF